MHLWIQKSIALHELSGFKKEVCLRGNGFYVKEADRFSAREKVGLAIDAI